MKLEKQIQARLTALDHNLFLDKEYHPLYKFLFYCVKYRMKDVEPLRVVDWYVGSTPLPLSMDIVEKVRSQEGDIREDYKKTLVNNAARKELLRQQRLAEHEQVVDEWRKIGKHTFVSHGAGGNKTPR